MNLALALCLTRTRSAPRSFSIDTAIPSGFLTANPPTYEVDIHSVSRAGRKEAMQIMSVRPSFADNEFFAGAGGHRMRSYELPS